MLAFSAPGRRAVYLAGLVKRCVADQQPQAGKPQFLERCHVAFASQLIAEAGISPSEITALLHGTTVSTNIVLEETGAKVGLLVTKDFEQVLHLARSQTPGPLAGWMIMEKPDPLADLELTRGIPERVNARGDVLTPLDETAAR